MLLVMAAVAALSNAPAVSKPQATDFGVRTVGGSAAPASVTGESWRPLSGSPQANTSLRSAASIGARWGQVTSTVRSAARNRAVGGVRNSWHLSGRAIDIARRAGVTHAQIAAAYRAAGYHLIESLDEGDHSHFAFGSGAAMGRRSGGSSRAVTSGEVTQWRIVTAPNSGSSRMASR